MPDPVHGHSVTSRPSASQEDIAKRTREFTANIMHSADPEFFERRGKNTTFKRAERKEMEDLNKRLSPAFEKLAADRKVKPLRNYTPEEIHDALFPQAVPGQIPNPAYNANEIFDYEGFGNPYPHPQFIPAPAVPRAEKYPELKAKVNEYRQRLEQLKAQPGYIPGQTENLHRDVFNAQTPQDATEKKQWQQYKNALLLNELVPHHNLPLESIKNLTKENGALADSAYQGNLLAQEPMYFLPSARRFPNNNSIVEARQRGGQDWDRLLWNSEHKGQVPFEALQELRAVLPPEMHHQQAFDPAFYEPERYAKMSSEELGKILNDPPNAKTKAQALYHLMSRSNVDPKNIIPEELGNPGTRYDPNVYSGPRVAAFDPATTQAHDITTAMAAAMPALGKSRKENRDLAAVRLATSNVAHEGIAKAYDASHTLNHLDPTKWPSIAHLAAQTGANENIKPGQSDYYKSLMEAYNNQANDEMESTSRNFKESILPAMRLHIGRTGQALSSAGGAYEQKMLKDLNNKIVEEKRKRLLHGQIESFKGEREYHDMLRQRRLDAEGRRDKIDQDNFAHANQKIALDKNALETNMRMLGAKDDALRQENLARGEQRQLLAHTGRERENKEEQKIAAARGLQHELNNTTLDLHSRANALANNQPQPTHATTTPAALPQAAPNPYGIAQGMMMGAYDALNPPQQPSITINAPNGKSAGGEVDQPYRSGGNTKREHSNRLRQAYENQLKKQEEASEQFRGQRRQWNPVSEAASGMAASFFRGAGRGNNYALAGMAGALDKVSAHRKEARTHDAEHQKSALEIMNKVSDQQHNIYKDVEAQEHHDMDYDRQVAADANTAAHHAAEQARHLRDFDYTEKKDKERLDFDREKLNKQMQMKAKGATPIMDGEGNVIGYEKVPFEQTLKGRALTEVREAKQNVAAGYKIAHLSALNAAAARYQPDETAVNLGEPLGLGRFTGRLLTGKGAGEKYDIYNGVNKEIAAQLGLLRGVKSDKSQDLVSSTKQDSTQTALANEAAGYRGSVGMASPIKNSLVFLRNMGMPEDELDELIEESDVAGQMIARDHEEKYGSAIKFKDDKEKEAFENYSKNLINQTRGLIGDLKPKKGEKKAGTEKKAIDQDLDARVEERAKKLRGGKELSNFNLSPSQGQSDDQNSAYKADKAPYDALQSISKPETQEKEEDQDQLDAQRILYDYQNPQGPTGGGGDSNYKAPLNSSHPDEPQGPDTGTPQQPMGYNHEASPYARPPSFQNQEALDEQHHDYSRAPEENNLTKDFEPNEDPKRYAKKAAEWALTAAMIHPAGRAIGAAGTALTKLPQAANMLGKLAAKAPGAVDKLGRGIAYVGDRLLGGNALKGLRSHAGAPSMAKNPLGNNTSKLGTKIGESSFKPTPGPIEAKNFAPLAKSLGAAATGAVGSQAITDELHWDPLVADLIGGVGTPLAAQKLYNAGRRTVAGAFPKFSDIVNGTPHDTHLKKHLAQKLTDNEIKDMLKADASYENNVPDYNPTTAEATASAKQSFVPLVTAKRRGNQSRILDQERKNAQAVVKNIGEISPDEGGQLLKTTLKNEHQAEKEAYDAHHAAHEAEKVAHEAKKAQLELEKEAVNEAAHGLKPSSMSAYTDIHGAGKGTRAAYDKAEGKLLDTRRDTTKPIFDDAYVGITDPLRPQNFTKKLHEIATDSWGPNVDTVLSGLANDMGIALNPTKHSDAAWRALPKAKKLELIAKSKTPPISIENADITLKTITDKLRYLDKDADKAQIAVLKQLKKALQDDIFAVAPKAKEAFSEYERLSRPLNVMWGTPELRSINSKNSFGQHTTTDAKITQNFYKGINSYSAACKLRDTLGADSAELKEFVNYGLNDLFDTALSRNGTLDVKKLHAWNAQHPGFKGLDPDMHKNLLNLAKDGDVVLDKGAALKNGPVLKKIPQPNDALLHDGAVLSSIKSSKDPVSTVKDLLSKVPEAQRRQAHRELGHEAMQDMLKATTVRGENLTPHKFQKYFDANKKYLQAVLEPQAFKRLLHIDKVMADQGFAYRAANTGQSITQSATAFMNEYLAETPGKMIVRKAAKAVGNKIFGVKELLPDYLKATGLNEAQLKEAVLDRFLMDKGFAKKALSDILENKNYYRFKNKKYVDGKQTLTHAMIMNQKRDKEKN